MRPFSAPRQRSMERTHYSNNRTLNAIKGTNTIPNLATYTTPSLRTNIGPIYPSRYGIHDELNHKTEWFAEISKPSEKFFINYILKNTCDKDMILDVCCNQGRFLKELHPKI